MATMLRLEKSKRIEFTPGRGTTRGQNALKWMGVYAKGSGTLDGINFHSFFRLWQLVLLMSYSNLLQGVLNMCRKCSFSWLLSLNNAIFYTKTPTNSSHCLSACSSSTKYNIIQWQMPAEGAFPLLFRTPWSKLGVNCNMTFREQAVTAWKMNENWIRRMFLKPWHMLTSI